MKKSAPKKIAKKQPAKYQEKVVFEGSFDQLINISTTGAGTKKKKEKRKK